MVLKKIIFIINFSFYCNADNVFYFRSLTVFRNCYLSKFKISWKTRNYFKIFGKSEGETVAFRHECRLRVAMQVVLLPSHQKGPKRLKTFMRGIYFHLPKNGSEGKI